jgi:hypothetical protein
MTNTTTFKYQEYLASREWAEKREAVRERSGDRCERCGGPQQAVHHLTYERIGHELLEDLQAVCDPCHEYLSAKREDDPAAHPHPRLFSLMNREGWSRGACFLLGIALSRVDTKRTEELWEYMLLHDSRFIELEDAFLGYADSLAGDQYFARLPA